MIVLDTNVISELTRQVPEPGIRSWLDSLPAEEIATTAITAAELRYGVARMPNGRLKSELAAAVHGLLGDDFRDRVLPFDDHCASRYAGHSLRQGNTRAADRRGSRPDRGDLPHSGRGLGDTQHR